MAANRLGAPCDSRCHKGLCVPHSEELLTVRAQNWCTYLTDRVERGEGCPLASLLSAAQIELELSYG